MAKIMKTLSPAEREEYYRKVAKVESPAHQAEMEKYTRLADAAAAEPTFSGALRRAIRDVHHRGMFLPTLLERAQVDWDTLRPFMIGDAPLPSDAIDRLIHVLGLHPELVPGAPVHADDE